MRKLIAVFIIALIALALSCNVGLSAQKKHATEWTEDDIVQYVQMTMGTYLRDAKFSSAEDARTRTSTHLAAACQILKNEGVIYSYDITAFTRNNDSARVLLKISQDVGDFDSIAIMFEIFKNDEPMDAPKYSTKRILG